MVRSTSKRTWIAGAGFLAAVAALGLAEVVLEGKAAAEAQAAVQAPMFEVDPFWPRPLPNHWVLGSSVGVTVDARDHVFIIHRGAGTLNAETEIGLASSPRTAEACCLAAPPVLEFDPAGNLVGHWGGPGPGYDWPNWNHGIATDDKGNVWIAGGEKKDAQVLKFTAAGKFLMQVGRPGQSRGSNDTENFGRPAKIFVDPKANEAYVADGYGNRRVAVIDADTGKFKRYWGAYGNKPDDTDLGKYDPEAPPAPQFRTPVHCAELANDGLVYVCDRPNDRIQVFQKDGKFVKEGIVSKNTTGAVVGGQPGFVVSSFGSAWDIAFSNDPQQRYLFVADGHDKRVIVLQRDTLAEVGGFGTGGRLPGQFLAVGSIAVDSRGNVYTGEQHHGKRVQKWSPAGR